MWRMRNDWVCESPAEAVGKSDLDCLPREQAGRLYAAEQEPHRGMERSTRRRKRWWTCERGEPRWWLTTKVPLRDQCGQSHRPGRHQPGHYGAQESGSRVGVPERASWCWPRATPAWRKWPPACCIMSAMSSTASMSPPRSFPSGCASCEHPNLGKVAATHASPTMADLAQFLTHDEKGRQVAGITWRNSPGTWASEQKELLGEIKELWPTTWNISRRSSPCSRPTPKWGACRKSSSRRIWWRMRYDCCARLMRAIR